MMNKIRMAANVQPRTLKDAIDFQIGMVGLAQITGRDELFEAAKEQGLSVNTRTTAPLFRGVFFGKQDGRGSKSGMAIPLA